jgi:hypothetical protein
VTAASSRRVVVAIVIVAVAASVLFRPEGSTLDRIVTTRFIDELVTHVVDGESDSSSEVRATIASVAWIGVLDSEDELVHLAHGRDDALHLVDLGETCFELIGERRRSSAVGGVELKEISPYRALLCDALITKTRED